MKVKIFGSLPAFWEDFIIDDKTYPIRMITIITPSAWDADEGPYPIRTNHIDGDCIDVYSDLDELTEQNVKPILCSTLDIEDSQLELTVFRL